MILTSPKTTAQGVPKFALTRCGPGYLHVKFQPKPLRGLSYAVTDHSFNQSVNLLHLLL